MTTASRPESDARLWLGRANAAGAAFLLIAGGLVTSTDSGLAVPDWPLSYGQWMPAMAGGVFFEHGHRMTATLIGFLILVMAFWTQARETRPAVRRLAWWTLFAVCLQGVLGGVTVLYGLPVAVSAAHATIGQTVFCLLIVMAELLAWPTPERPSVPVGTTRWLGALAVGALWLQLVLGAVLRHGGSGILWHVLGAVLAMAAAGWAGSAVLLERPEPALRRPALSLLALLSLQLLLGAATAGLRLAPAPRANPAMIAVATTHLIVGAFLLGNAVLLCLRLFRMDRA